MYEIFPDSCIDEVAEAGTKYNENGITWIRKYCEQALPSINGMSLRCEFLDEERTILCGHGETERKDGLPIFENADVIGHFTKGYIDTITNEANETKTVCIGEGEIDALCYNNFVTKLEEDIANGEAPYGSVEILKTGTNEGIIYKYGYKNKGRIPTIFEHSGYALLGVRPADKAAKILELNSKEDSCKMNEKEIKALINDTVSEVLNHTAEINKCKEECAKSISETNESLEAVTAEKEEAVADVEKIKEALEQCKKDLDASYQKESELYAEIEALRDELGKAKAKERIAELESAVAEFNEAEKEYAETEINAFKENPTESEINTVVSKIWEGIGKMSKKESVTAEQNSAKEKAKEKVEDIFSDMEGTSKSSNTDIFSDIM